MKRLLVFLIIFIVSRYSIGQVKFKIILDAPEYQKDSLFFGYPSIRKGFNEFYKFDLINSQQSKDYTDITGASLYKIGINDKNILEGVAPYPQPVVFMFIDPNSGRPSGSSIFLLDSGIFHIHLPKKEGEFSIRINSHANNQYHELNSLLAMVPDSLDKEVTLIKRENIIKNYIRNHPNSYAALWEIIKDYSAYNYNPIFFETLNVFSFEFKWNNLFRGFESKLSNEKISLDGQKMPNIIHLGDANNLTTEDFKSKKITIIDYWGVSCSPCIADLPELVKIYNFYKNKGLQIISISDDITEKNQSRARLILKNNHVTWDNYFDNYHEFQRKVNATTQPLFFVIDSNGKIIKRLSNNLQELRETLKHYLE